MRYPSNFNNSNIVYYNTREVLISDETGSPIGVSTITGLDVNTSRGGWVTLLSEALVGVTSSTQIFANAPSGTAEIWLTLRGEGLTIRTDAGIATALVSGHDFDADASTPYVFDMNQAQALNVRAVQMGVAASGWITYRGDV
jgi:hypothetical protein